MPKRSLKKFSPLDREYLGEQGFNPTEIVALKILIDEGYEFFRILDWSLVEKLSLTTYMGPEEIYEKWAYKDPNGTFDGPHETLKDAFNEAWALWEEE